MFDQTKETSPTTYWLACLLPLIVGNLLMLIPERHISTLRDLQRDALGPGEKIILATSDFSQAQLHAYLQTEQSQEQTDRERTLEANLATVQFAVTQLREELDSTRNQLEFFQSIHKTTPLEQASLLEARVLGREALLEDSLQFVINAGQSSKVESGQPVFWEHEWTIDLGKDHQLTGDELIHSGHLLLGRIKSVGQTTSLMQPVTNSSFRTIARILRPNGQTTESDVGSLSGTGKSTCRLHYISASTPVSEGDLVITDTSSPSQSALVGTITKAELPPGQPDWFIEVTPATTGLIPSQVTILQRQLTRIQ